MQRAFIATSCRAVSTPVTSPNSTFGIESLAEQTPYRRSDIAGRQPRRGNLIEQRLEQMIVVTIDQGDTHGRPRQSCRTRKTAEARADDNHPRQPV